uniref:Retrovirus-related Pol polyprotein from transposon TNT 1-94 n=1 Tax=Tanacetum cinerariifolium TaxID=118510 RepID=A0A6L2P5Z4_TANCI|nr:hypothetical protein [Tanacetum cinerariifolium]
MRNIMFMHAARDDSILGPMRFVSKSDAFQVYGALLPNSMTNQKMLDSDAYKTYLAYATGASSPKMKRKLKKPTSPLKKKTFVIVEKEEPEPAKKKAPEKVARRKGIELLSDAALLKEAQLKKALERSKSKTTIHQAGNSFESEYELWGDSGYKDANDKKGDDERTEFDDEPTETDNPKTTDDEEEIHDDEFVYMPEDYVPTDDELNDVTKGEYKRISEELYGDVNVSLTDAEPGDKEKHDVEMTVAGHVNINQEDVGNQVNDDAQVTQKTKGPISSSFISSDYAAKYLNFDNICPVDTKVVSMLDINVQHKVPQTSPLFTNLVFIIPEHNVINPLDTVTTASATTISSFMSSLFSHLQQSTPILTPTTTKATTSTTTVPDSETLIALHQ